MPGAASEMSAPRQSPKLAEYRDPGVRITGIEDDVVEKLQGNKKIPESARSTSDPRARHSEDFTSVDWFGTRHTITSMQAACIAVLWKAWENHTPGLRQTTILDRAGSEMANKKKPSLAKLFEDNPAWGTMIVPVPEARGAYQMSDLPTE
jgi:hypothetical protein